MPHRLTTVEAAGDITKYAGYSLVLRVVKSDNRSVVIDRKVGVMANGHFTLSIPAYSLEDGTYFFGVSGPIDLKNVLAAGTFKIAAVNTSSGSVSQSGAPISTASQLSGHWYGIAGTSADLQLYADGTYVSAHSVKGTWCQSGNQVTFTGPLSAWNQGRGQLNPKGDVIEFQWTTATGAKQYFVIGKY